MKRIFSIIMIAASMLFVVGCGNNGANKGNKGGEEAEAVTDTVAVAQTPKTIMDKIAAMPAEPVFDIVTTLGTIRDRKSVV